MSLNSDVFTNLFYNATVLFPELLSLRRYTGNRLFASHELPTFHKIHAKNGFRVKGYSFSSVVSTQSCVSDAMLLLVFFCCCLPTRGSAHLLGYACVSEENTVCVYTVQRV